MKSFPQASSGFLGYQLTALYDNVEEKLELLSSFFKEGLEKGEYCVWLLSSSLDCEKSKVELKKSGLDVDLCSLQTQLEIISLNQVELMEEGLPLNIGELLEKKYEYAASKGFFSLRAGIDLQIPAGVNPLSFIQEYRRSLDFFFRNNRVSVLNTCPLKAFSTSEVLDLLEENQGTIIKRKGGWMAPFVLPNERVGDGFPLCPVHDKRVSENWTSEGLKRSEGKFKSIFDNLEDAVVVCDLDFRILEVSNRACERLGYSKDEFLMMPVWKLETPYYRSIFKEQTNLVMDSERAVFEVKALHKDGTVIPYEVITTVMDYEGEQFILGIGRDISEKKAVFETLKKSEEKFRNIFDNSNDLIIIHDMQGRILEVNRVCCKRMGYSYDKMLRMSLEDIKGPGVQKDVREEIEEFKKYGYVVMEIECLCKDGSTFPCEISNRVINFEGRPAVLSVGRDITEQKRARKELERSEERYRAITRMIKLLLYSENFETGDIELLGAIPDITGYSFDEFQNVDVEAWLDMIHPGDRESIMAAHEKCFLEGGDFHEEYRLRQKNGNYIHVEDNGVYLKNKSNKVFRAAGAVRDITDRKQAARALEKSEEKFRIAAEQTGQIIFDCDLLTGSVEWAGAIEELTGYSPEEFRTFSIDLWKSIHPDDAGKFFEEYERTLKDSNRYRGEYRFRRKDGSYFYAEDCGIILRGETGRPHRIIGAIKDITPIKVTSEKLRESEALYRSFLQNFSGVAFQIDKDFNLIFSRGKQEEITGYTEEDFTSGNMSWHKLVDPRDVEMLRRDEEFLRENPESTVEKEYRIIRKDGEIRWVHDLFQCIHDDKGNILYYQGFLYDISEKKAAEEAILHAKIESEVARNTKTDFIVNMSHELRTPLNSIIGFSDLLQLEIFGNLNSKQLKHVKNISISAKHLLDLINNLLDLSKIEAGKSEMYYEEVSVPDVISEVNEVISQKAREKDIILETRIAEDIKMVRADRVKFKQIFYNLLSNAIKFTPAGGNVSVTAVGRENYLEVSVTDTGIGIPADKLEVIFHPFVQADSSTSREFGGTGLGLALVKEFVEIHGGNIWVNSEPEKGSTFTFTLPWSHVE